MEHWADTVANLITLGVRDVLMKGSLGLVTGTFTSTGLEYQFGDGMKVAFRGSVTWAQLDLLWAGYPDEAKIVPEFIYRLAGPA